MYTSAVVGTLDSTDGLLDLIENYEPCANVWRNEFQCYLSSASKYHCIFDPRFFSFTN